MADDSEPIDLTGEDLDTWSTLATVLEWLPAALDAQLTRDAQLTHFEFGILYALSTAEDHTLRMSTLAGYANSSLSRLSRAVARLERRTWVIRRTDPSDGRATLACLTDAGVAATEAALPGHAALVHRVVLSRLTAAQKRQLRDISLRIQKGIREEPGWSREDAYPAQ